MSLGVARGLFLVAALSVSAFAAASWYEPGPGVVTSTQRSNCLSPKIKRVTQVSPEANQNLFILVMGLSQARR